MLALFSCYPLLPRLSVKIQVHASILITGATVADPPVHFAGNSSANNFVIPVQTPHPYIRENQPVGLTQHPREIHLPRMS
jgi:hypothetical protein